MNKRDTITIGLSFPNSILFGFTFVLLGIYFFTNLADYFSFTLLLFGTVFLILGLFSVTTFRKIKIDKELNEIYLFNSFMFFIKIGVKYNLNEFDKIVVGTKIRNYATGGGFLITAKSFNSIKETDIWIVKTGTRKRIEIKNVGNKKKTNRIVDRIAYLSELKV